MYKKYEMELAGRTLRVELVANCNGNSRVAGGLEQSEELRHVFAVELNRDEHDQPPKTSYKNSKTDHAATPKANQQIPP